MKLTFDEAAHAYRVDDRPVDSVTQLIALAGRGVNYSSVPDHVLDRARERGIHVDLACDFYDANRLDWNSVHPQWKPYVEAWVDFRRSCAVTVLRNQGRIYHQGLDYAGSFDALAMIDGKVVVIDRKCSKEVHRDPYALQLAAYAMPAMHVAEDDGTLVPMAGVAERWVVQLTPRTFNVVKMTDPDDFEDFKAVVRLARRTARYTEAA